jgi:hypothetical protein
VPSSLAESRQRKNPNPPRVLLEGGGGLGFFRHDYCYISWHQRMYRVAHSVLEHRLGAPSVVTFITKQAGLLRSRRSVRLSCGRRLWRGRRPLRLKALGAIGGELRAMLNMDFRELRKAEVEHRRIPLPRCEYPGEWLWATPRSGLTLLPRGPQGCLASDSSAGRLGVARRPPEAGAAS